MNKRPKSREETPKEGSDSARRYRTATICDRAAQNARVFESFPLQSSQAWQIRNTAAPSYLFKYYQILKLASHLDPTALQLWYAKTLDFVINEVTENARLNEADSKADASRMMGKCSVGRARPPGLS
jgi:hypothetical protein